VAFAYLTNVLVLLFHVVLFPVGAVGLSAFSSPYGGTLWPLELLLVTAATGAGSIAEDLSSRSITLYLSRPIHLIDYLGGKAAGLGFWVVHEENSPGERPVPTIMRRTVKSLKRSAAKGVPITRRLAARAAAKQVRRVLGSPKAARAAILRNSKVTRRYKRPRRRVRGRRFLRRRRAMI